MLDHLIDETPDAIPLLALSSAGLGEWLTKAPAHARAWVESTKFSA